MNPLLAAARKRQSPRTGFLHLYGEEESLETIPFYENLCLALLLQKERSTEAVLEGKQILDRLLAFQAPDGNFPVYLHDYPRCFDRLMPLKAGPLLKQMKKEGALEKSLSFLDLNRPLSALWRARLAALRGDELPLFQPSGSEEWSEHLLTLQVAAAPLPPLPFDPHYQVYQGDPEGERQEGYFPKPSLFEWALGRPLLDHPLLVRLAPYETPKNPSFLPSHRKRLFFGPLHSLLFADQSLFVDARTDVTINGKKATLFEAGDQIEIRYEGGVLILQTAVRGGEAIGHLSRGNRPFQTKREGAFDWHLFWRPLRGDAISGSFSV